MSRYGLGKLYGFKLLGVINPLGMVCRFALVPANEHGASLAKALFNQHRDKLSVLGDKRDGGTGIYARLRDKARVWGKIAAHNLAILLPPFVPLKVRGE